MNEKTLKALKGSIKKWEKIRDGTGYDNGPNNCPLCKLFFWQDCGGCPVKEKTGETSCVNTPYESWRDANDNYKLDKSLSARGRRRAQREIDFLVSLLPKDSK